MFRVFVIALFVPALARAQFTKTSILADALRESDVFVLTEKQAKDIQDAYRLSIQDQRRAANQQSSKEWNEIKNKADWEKFRDAKIELLRKSLNVPATVPDKVATYVTRTIPGDGFVIENLIYESRPGFYVTANLYKPHKPDPKGIGAGTGPGFVIIHSHHNPKTEGELQDMGMTWARAGCFVLVPDQLGHGERRVHPFTEASKFPESFKPSRQDYYFRYNTSLQLYLAGESLMGWMAWDNSRGIDVLIAKGADPKRIAVLGAVAGGGDPAAVTAALDPRVAAVVPFNFGGPQPETKFPLPPDAELNFNYMGGGSWESTRNLHATGRDGTMPWVIVGSVAPRGLVYGHEFAWEQANDPVWKRFQTIWNFYDALPKITWAKGSGSVQGRPPESTHCNNIGAVHRVKIHPAFHAWFDVPLPNPEYVGKRLPSADLQCWTPELREKLKPKPLHVAAREAADARLAEAAKRQEGLNSKQKTNLLARELHDLLGGPVKKSGSTPGEIGRKVNEIQIVTHIVQSSSGVQVPVTLLIPPGAKAKQPVVVCLSQAGKKGFRNERATDIATLLLGGVAVCLPDVRGTGEIVYDTGRGRTSGSTSLAATALMLGQPMLGGRLEDLQAVLLMLESHFDGGRIALWGDSFAKVNDGTKPLTVPYDVTQPPNAEPLGGLLAILGAATNPHIRAVYVQGGLASYKSILDDAMLHVPHDVVVPGILKTGDVPDWTASLLPRPVRVQGMVDGLNRRLDGKALEGVYRGAQSAYSQAKVADRFSTAAEAAAPGDIGKWLLANLQ